MKKIVLSSVTAGFLLVGCGGGGGSATDNNKSLKEVKVVDSYIVDATVCDEKGICAPTDAKGVARANFDLNSTLTSVGGFIDSNFNGIQDSGELEAPFLKAPAGATIVTPLTELVANGADINKLAEMFNITPNDILHTDPFSSSANDTEKVKLVKAINAVYPVIKENRVKELATSINNYSSNGSSSDLPNFGESTQKSNPYNLVKSVLTDGKDITFVSNVEKSISNNPLELGKNLESIKKIPAPIIPKNENIKKDTQIKENNSIATKSDIQKDTQIKENDSTTNNIKKQTNPQPIIANNGKSDLPNFDASPSSPTTKQLEAKSDLPAFDSKNIKPIPSKEYNYNPSYQPVPKTYWVKNNSLDEFIELKKDSDTKYEFKNEKLFNVADKEFNATKLFDINASYVFNDLNFSTDGNLNGTISINLKDLNDSSEKNFTKSAQFTINNAKVIKTKLNNVQYNKFDINLSKIMENYNESEYNQTNHNYSFKIDYNVSGKILSLLGKYRVVKNVIPAITLTPVYNNSFLVTKNSDINLSIGSTNVANTPCEISGVSGLKCIVDNNKNIYLQGKTPNSDNGEIDVVTLKVGDNAFTNSKDFYLEVLNPAQKQILSNWNLKSDGDYSGHRIEMNLTGSLGNNSIDVNTSASPSTGAPENNVTVYLYNKSNNANNYIRFVFDANIYKSNDWFIIKRDDNKTAKFRVGDVSVSQNGFFFK